ncbi:hypothetical protein WDU94_010831 [Cyamophila willieti]
MAKRVMGRICVSKFSSTYESLLLSPTREYPMDKGEKGKSLDDSNSNQVEAFSTCLEVICKEVKLMRTWLGNNFNSRTALREYIDRAEKEVCTLEEMRDRIDVNKEQISGTRGKCRRQEAPSSSEIKEKIRSGCQNQDQEAQEALEALKQTKWPGEAFICTKVIRGDPVQHKEENIIFWLGADPHQNKNLLKMARTKFHQLDEVIENGKIVDNFQILEVMSRARGVTRKEMGCLVNSQDLSTQEVLKRKEHYIKEEEIKEIAVVSIFQYEQLRKELEIAFLESELKVKIYIPKGMRLEGKPNQTQNDKEIIKLKAKEISYAAIAKSVRENFDPDRLGIELKDMNKSKEDEITIVTNKGADAEKIKLLVLRLK